MPSLSTEALLEFVTDRRMSDIARHCICSDGQSVLRKAEKAIKEDSAHFDALVLRLQRAEQARDTWCAEYGRARDLLNSCKEILLRVASTGLSVPPDVPDDEAACGIDFGTVREARRLCRQL